ncbi:acyltransferase family protein [Pseudomonas nicosulfuronedens]
MEGNRRIKGLDGLRGLAVLMVFIEHRMIYSHGFGNVGVRVFFVLSGFLIVGILHSERHLIEMRCRSLRSAILCFWERRVRRIFPIYYVVIAVFFIWFSRAGYSYVESGVYWHATFTTNIWTGVIRKDWSEASHFWTLATEEQFYLLAAPVLLFVPLKVHLRLSVFVLAVAIVTAICLYLLGANAVSIETFPMVAFGFLAAGGTLRLALDRIGRIGIIYLLSSAVLVVISIGCSWVLGSVEFYMVSAPLSLIAAIFLVGYIVTNQGSSFVGLLELRWLKYTGTISYGFYVLHAFFEMPDWALQLISAESGAYRELAYVVGSFLLSFGAAALSWHFLEKPILKRSPPREAITTSVA